MSRRPSTPSYRLHKPTGQAVVTLNGHDHYLGKHDTAESRELYDRKIAEWLANGRREPIRAGAPGDATALTVNELLLAYLRHAQTYYAKDGRPTSQQDRIRLALRPVWELYGRTDAKDFGPLALKAVRERMIAHGYVRSHVNALVGCVKRMFKWAVAEELVPAAVLHGLEAVTGLRRGRTKAPDNVPVAPVAPAVVEDTLPHLTATSPRWCACRCSPACAPGKCASCGAATWT
jgi:hypothetical protein